MSPNEIAAETPYIANNIEATRWAFGLDEVASVSSSATTDLTAADVKANEATIDNVRLWEPRPALSTYSADPGDPPLLLLHRTSTSTATRSTASTARCC